MIRHGPTAMKREHDELHTALTLASYRGGRTAAAATEVTRLLRPHFIKEEAFVLPVLGVLPELAQGKVETVVPEVLNMVDRFAAEYEQMLADHKAIGAALKTLSAAATDEGKSEVLSLGRQLAVHAQMEEELAYPATLLVGRYLQAISAIPPRATS